MQGQKPIKKFRSGNFELAFWENEKPVNDVLVSFKTMSLSRSFKKKEEDIWRNELIHLRRSDIPKLLALLQKGLEEMYLNEQNDREEED
ncbi:MAG: hypothetical protein AABW49_03040 [Nanoarchaeota archaeon]